MKTLLKSPNFSSYVPQCKTTISWLVVLSCCARNSAALPAAEQPKEVTNVSILISATELLDEIELTKPTILDARARADFEQAHISGAVWVDVADWKSLAGTDGGLHDKSSWGEKVGQLGLNRDSRVVVYGDQLSNAARIWWLLKYVGIENVALVDGGWQWWVKQNGPMETTTTSPEAVAFEPEFQSDRVEEMDSLSTSFDSPDVLPLDSRSTAEFTGEDARAKRGGHIPGAVHLEWTELLAADGRFKSLDQLQALFRDRGILPAVTAVCY